MSSRFKNEDSKENKKVLPLLQKADRTENKASGNRLPKRNFNKSLKAESQIEKSWKRHGQLGKMGIKTGNIQKQKKNKNKQKNKHNVYLQCLRKIKIQAGQKK